MGKFRKTTSVLLLACLLLTMMPGTAGAANLPDTIDDDYDSHDMLLSNEEVLDDLEKELNEECDEGIANGTETLPANDYDYDYKYPSDGDDTEPLYDSEQDEYLPSDGHYFGMEESNFAPFNTGSLTFSPTGPGSPLQVTVIGFTGTLPQNLIIPDTHFGRPVVAIGNGALSGATSLRSVVIPDSVVSIGSRAFANCTDLSSVTLSRNLESLGEGAFLNNTRLTSINIPRSLNNVVVTDWSIREMPFQGSALRTVTFETGTTQIPANLFRNVTTLENVTIPATVTSIGNHAFEGATALQSIVFPNSVTSIGDHAFDGATRLGHVQLPQNLVTLGDFAFRNTSLTSIHIPRSITSGSFAFSGSGLRTVTFAEGTTNLPSALFGGTTNLETIVLPRSVQTMESAVFSGATGLRSVTLPQFLSSISSQAFRGATSLQSVVIPDNSILSIGAEAFSGATSLQSIIIPDSVTSIGNSAFDGATSLSHVQLPQNLVTLGSNAFRNNTSLESITIPSNVTTIGNGVFSGATSLENVVLSSGIQVIPSQAFFGNTSLKEITIPTSVTTIGRQAFAENTALRDVFIPSSVTSIDQEAFSANMFPNLTFHGVALSYAESWANSRGITFVIWDNPPPPPLYEISITPRHFPFAARSLPYTPPPAETWTVGNTGNRPTGLLTVTNSNSAAFTVSRVGLNNIPVGGAPQTFTVRPRAGLHEGTHTAVINIRGENGIHEAFAVSFAVRSEAVGPGFTYRIGQNEEGHNVATVTGFVGTIPNNELIIPAVLGGFPVTAIGDWAFINRAELETVVIPYGVTSIGFWAFENCINLSSVAIPDSMISIGFRAFANCTSLSSVTIPDSVIGIGQAAFLNCTSLTGIVIPDSVTYIGSSAFDGATSLSHVQLSQNLVTLGSNAFRNTSFTTIHIPRSITSASTAFSGSSLRTVTFAEGITTLPIRLFSGVANMETIAIPDTVTTIGGYAFSGTTSLRSVTLPQNLETIGSGAFFGATSLQSIVIPDSVTSIDDRAFSGATGLSHVQLSQNLVTLGQSAFRDNTSLESITIPNSVTAIGNGAFSGATSLENVVLSDSLQIIPSGAFANTSLKEITIPASVTAIQSNAFGGNTALRNVFIPSSVTNIDQSAFGDSAMWRNLTFHTPPGSHAEHWARNFRGITVVHQHPPPVYEISITPGDRIFADRTLPNYTPPSAVTWTVSNTGNQATGVLTITNSNDDAFTVSTGSLTNIPVGVLTRSFTVRPRAGLEAGTYTATITVSGANNIYASFTVSFTVHEEVYIPAVYEISITPGDFTFEERILPNYTPPPTVIWSVSNTGNRATGPLTITNSNSESFNVGASSFTSIPVGGAARTFGIRPRAGLASGIHTATITVTGDNGIYESFTVSFLVHTNSPVLIINQTPWSVSEAGGSRVVYFTSNILWTAQSSAPWVTVGPASGFGDGNITITAAPNEGVSARSAAVTVSGIGISRTIHVEQAGRSNITPTLTVSRALWPAPVAGSSISVNITSNTSWTAVSNVPAWLTVTPASGTNNGSITITATANTGVSTRNGAITVSGGGIIRIIDVVQVGRQTTNAPAQPTAGGTPTVDSITVGTIPAPNGWTTQYRIRIAQTGNWGAWQNSNTFTGLTANTDYQVQARFMSNNTATHSHSAESQISNNIRTAATTIVPTFGISVTPGNHTFPARTLPNYTAPPAATWTVRNTGNQPTGALTVTNSNTAAFTISTASLASIPAETATRTFTVTPRAGLAAGTHRATITVRGGASITAQSFTVTFVVNPAPQAPVQTGWARDGANWTYMLANGSRAVGWRHIGNIWYHFTNAGIMQTGWRHIGNVWYFFNSGGAMQTGWQNIGNVWYFFNAGGAMQTGWQHIGNVWYFFNAGGAMQTGWQSIGNVWYFFCASGAMQTGWQLIGNVWYFFDSGGVMQTGWQLIGGTWYFFDSGGAMVTGQHQIGSAWHLFSSGGVWLG